MKFACLSMQRALVKRLILFVPTMCLFALILIRRLKNDASIQIPIISVVIQVIAVSVYFEWYLPSQNSQYTGDLLDVVMYVIGGMFFLFLQRKL